MNPETTTQPVPTYGQQVSGGTAVYNPNTGAPLAGAGAYNPNNGAKIQQTPIPADIIGKTTANVPPPVPPPQNYSGAIAGATSGISPTPPIAPNIPANTSGDTQNVPAPAKSFKDTLAEVLGMTKAPPSTADAYAQAEKDAGIADKQNLVSSLTNQLNALNAESQNVTNQVQQNNQNTGATDQGINPQVAGQLRVIALKSLPIAAQLSAAQGDLATAQTHLDKYFSMVTADAQAQTDYYNKAVDTAYGMFSDAEKQQLDAINAQKASDTQSMRDAVNNAQTYAKSALDNGDNATVKAITELPAPDPSSPTFKQDLQDYNAAVANITASMKQDPSKALDNQLKQAQIDKIHSDIAQAEQTANANGTITGKPQTASQSTAQSYANRMNEANVIIGTLGSKFTTPNSIGGHLPNFLQSGDRQAYEQAKKNFVTAILRRESGASIAPSEFKTAEEQYFPQAGDKPAVLTQKEQLRNTVINNFYKESNTLRPVLPNQIIESDGKRYKVGSDGETLTEVK